jgi:arabinogalactan oligomer/maltooligosaccharide transport system substrate-binding protein
MVLGLVACGGNAPETTAPKADAGESTPAEAEKITLKVWGPNEDQIDENSFLPVACEKFDEAHPEWDIEFVFEVCAEGDAGGLVTKDPAAAADVYTFANDQLGTLLQSNAIARLGGAALDQVMSDNTETMIASVTSGEGVYGVPFTGNTWFMYYDKSVYSEDDIKSLDAMMAIKPVGFEVTNTWYLPAFYFAAGGTMFGAEGIDGAAGVQFGGEAGAAATLYVANALAAGTMIEAGGGAGLDAMRNGTIGAMFSGTWDAKNYKDVLGENYAAAQLPCITLNGVECQLRSFAGSKCYGANPNSANLAAAIALAAWLGSSEMQDLHYQIRNGEVIPCSVSLIASGEYDVDAAAVAQNDTIVVKKNVWVNSYIITFINEKL